MGNFHLSICIYGSFPSCNEARELQERPLDFRDIRASIRVSDKYPVDLLAEKSEKPVLTVFHDGVGGEVRVDHRVIVAIKAVVEADIALARALAFGLPIYPDLLFGLTLPPLRVAYRYLAICGFGVLGLDAVTILVPDTLVPGMFIPHARVVIDIKVADELDLGTSSPGPNTLHLFG